METIFYKIYNFLLASFVITFIPYMILGVGFLTSAIDFLSLWRFILGLVFIGIVGIKFAILFYLSPYFEE